MGWMIHSNPTAFQTSGFFSPTKMAPPKIHPEDVVGSNPKQFQAFLTSLGGGFKYFLFPALPGEGLKPPTRSPIQNKFKWISISSCCDLKRAIRSIAMNGAEIPSRFQSAHLSQVSFCCWLFIYVYICVFFFGGCMSTVCIKCRLRPKKNHPDAHIWIKRSKYFSNTLCYPAVSISTFYFQFC